jgi:hypothetical protein
MWYVVLTFKVDIFRSDFTRSFMQFQQHNITSDKLIDQNNERIYHVKQTVEKVFKKNQIWQSSIPQINISLTSVRLILKFRPVFDNQC